MRRGEKRRRRRRQRERKRAKSEKEKRERERIRLDSCHGNARDKTRTLGAACLHNSHVTCRKHIYFSELTILKALNAIAVCKWCTIAIRDDFFDPPLYQANNDKIRPLICSPCPSFSLPRIDSTCSWTIQLSLGFSLVSSGCNKSLETPMYIFQQFFTWKWCERWIAMRWKNLNQFSRVHIFHRYTWLNRPFIGSALVVEYNEMLLITRLNWFFASRFGELYACMRGSLSSPLVNLNCAGDTSLMAFNYTQQLWQSYPPNILNINGIVRAMRA